MVLLVRSSGNLAPVERVGVLAPGGGRFLKAATAMAAAAAAVLVGGVGVVSITPGAVDGPLVAFGSPLRWTIRFAMVFAVAPKGAMIRCVC